MGEEIDDETLQDLYAWVDQVPLSRPKRNLSRDFSDGVMIAELVRHFLPRLVELHNYVPASATDKKMTNWGTLNRKVFRKLNFELSDDVIKSMCQCKAFTVERVLLMLRTKIDRAVFEQNRAPKRGSDKPEADQNKALPKAVSSNYSDASTVASYAGAAYSSSSQERMSEVLSPGGVNRSNVSQTVHPEMHAPGKTLPEYNQDFVPRMDLEEKKQELLAKDETVQILTAKVRRLEHLLHLKDIRIDDLQGRLDRLEQQMRPTVKHTKK